MENNTTTPDRGWSWVVLMAAFLCNLIFDGIIYSAGIFYVEILPYFNAGAAPTAWVGSVISGTYALVGPISSVLANRYGCRTVTIIGSVVASAGFVASTFSPNIYVMILTYGVIAGFGFGLMYLCAYVMIGYYFDKRRALATGIASCGSGVGTFILAPLSVLLISEYGWRGATWILAGVILNGVVAGMVFRPVAVPVVHKKEPAKEKQKEQLMDFSLLLNPTFVLFCLSSFLCLIGLFIPFMYLPAMAISHGISKRNAAFLLSIIGLTNTIARIACGYISDKPWANPLKIYNTALIIGGTATAFCTWSSSYIFLVIYAAIFGVSIAVYVSLCAIILVEFLGLDKLSNSFGFLNMFRGIATLIGAPLSGLLYDITQEYTLAFYVAGATIATAGVICVPLHIIGRCRPPSDDTPTGAMTLSEDELDQLASRLNSANLFCSSDSLASAAKKNEEYIGSIQSLRHRSVHQSPLLNSV